MLSMRDATNNRRLSKALCLEGFLGYYGYPPKYISRIATGFHTTYLQRIQYYFRGDIFPRSVITALQNRNTIPCDIDLWQGLADADFILSWDVFWKWVNEAILAHANKPADWDERKQPPSYCMPSRNRHRRTAEVDYQENRGRKVESNSMHTCLL